MRAPAFALVLALAACASSRGPVEDAEVTAQLGFLNRQGLTRADVEARLGEPRTRYERNSVASYGVYVLRDGRITATAPSRLPPRYTLMLEYAPDGRVLRHALLRHIDAK